MYYLFGFQNQLMVNWWFGILGVPISNHPIPKGIPGIQTTNPTTNLPLADRIHVCHLRLLIIFFGGLRLHEVRWVASAWYFWDVFFPHIHCIEKRMNKINHFHVNVMKTISIPIIIIILLLPFFFVRAVLKW